MKRLYYLTDSLNSADQTSLHLHGAGIADKYLHVLGNDKKEINLHHLHAASALDELDIVRLGWRGAVIGMILGFVCFISVLLAQILLHSISPVAMLGMVLIFPFLGVLVGMLFGFTKENYHIMRFHDQLRAGKYLFMVDVVERYEARIRGLMKQHIDMHEEGSDEVLIPALSY